jgi:hypothetical protein
LEPLARRCRFPPPAKSKVSSTCGTTPSKRFTVGGLLTPTNSTVSSSLPVRVPPPLKASATHGLLSQSNSTASSTCSPNIFLATALALPAEAQSMDHTTPSAEPALKENDTASLSQLRKRRRIVIACDSDDDDEPLRGGT